MPLGILAMRWLSTYAFVSCPLSVTDDIACNHQRACVFWSLIPTLFAWSSGFEQIRASFTNVRALSTSPSGDVKGGALFVEEASTINLIGATFTNCVASGVGGAYGGAVFAFKTATMVLGGGTTFNACDAHATGSGAIAYGGVVVLFS